MHVYRPLIYRPRETSDIQTEKQELTVPWKHLKIIFSKMQQLLIWGLILHTL